MAEDKKKHWMQGAVNPAHKGDFAAKAKAAGMSTAAYAHKVASDPNASALLKKQANLALVFMASNRRKRAMHK